MFKFTVYSSKTGDRVRGKFFLSSEGELYRDILGFFIPVKRKGDYVIHRMNTNKLCELY